MPQAVSQETTQGAGSDFIVIPADFMAFLTSHGYKGSAVVSKTKFQQIMDQYGIQQGAADTGGGATGFPIVSSSSGGGGGGGGGGGLSASALSNLRASFLSILHSWGFWNPGQNLLNLVEQGVSSKWSTTNFINHLRETSEYKDEFAGIQKGMSEAQYLSLYNWFRDRAKDVGYQLDKSGFGVLLKKGVDQSEWNARVDAAERVQENRQLLSAFEQTLRYRGLLKPKEKVSMGEFADFLRGMGSKQWEAVWEESSVTAQLENIGVDVARGGKGDVSRKELLHLINNWESRNPGQDIENLGDNFYNQLADQINKLVPASRLAGFKLTKSDILEMQLGGPRREEIAKRVQVVLHKIEGMKQPSVQPQAGLTDQGFRLVTGEPERAQTG